MNVVEISDDESDVTLDNDSDLDPVRPDTVDLTDDPEFTLTADDYLTDAGVGRLLRNWRSDEPTAARGVNSQRPYVAEEICVGGILYQKGQSVQLPRGRYLRIRRVVQYPDGDIFFKGWHMIKTRRHDGNFVPKGGKWENELIWIANENEEEVSLAEVRRIVTIHFTNHCDITNDPKKGMQGMFCRLKENLDKSGGSLQYISHHEADEGFKVDPARLRRLWRGQTRPFGESDVFTAKFSPSVIDLDEDDVVNSLRQRRWYTFGDGFCGAGGVSCGANQAGVEIKWAFDSSHHATRSYRLNFENAECELSTIDAFLTNDESFQRVDISHASPPCQTFSPAHTINGPNDDANSACIFSCFNLIKSAKPRVQTMEETSGLFFDRHLEILHRVILDFSELGYSVRWGILNCANYGAPQLRRRLVIIASGPGEVLPPFPEPTHGLQEFGLQPFVTINQMIANIPVGAPNHDIQSLPGRGDPRAPYDGNRQAKTITCGGGVDSYHPSGLRRFTQRESASLQTFPLEFRFGPHEVRKQIGNAVPPVLAKALYTEIKQSLQQTDEAEMRQFLNQN